MENNKNNGSTEMNLTLDSIINEYSDGGADNTETNKKEDTKSRLDELFRKNEDDLAWLEDFMGDEAAVTQDIAEESEKNTESEETIEAENVEDIFADPEESSAVSAEDTVADEKVFDDIPDSEPFEKEEKTDGTESAASETKEALPQDESENDGGTKIFGTVKPEDAQSGVQEKQSDDGSVDFDMFESDDDADAEEADKAPANAESDDVNKYLGKLFGSSDDEESDAENNEKKNAKPKSEHKKIAKELGAYEEIDMSDEKAVSEGQNRYYLKKCRALIALLGTAVFLLLGLYAELAPIANLPHPSVLSTDNPTLYALIDLQILCFGAMCVLDSLVSGFHSITDRRFSPSACALVIAAVCAVQTVATAVLCSTPESVRVFCSVGILALLMLALHDYLRASADDKAYRIASSTSNKFGAFEVGVDSPECAPFASHIDLDGAKVISVAKGSVYEGFVGRNEKRPASEKNLGKLSLVVGIVAAVVGVFMSVATKSVYEGITSAAIVFASSLPVNVFFVCALPKFLSAKKGKEFGAALIGQNASEEYKGLSVVAFEDTEVFLPKDVRISSIKTYGGMALDEAVILMSKIYGHVGGPLSKIFAKIVDVKTDDADVKLGNVYPDAIEVTVDGRKICLATASYLGANGIRIISDSVDNAFRQSHCSILFMVIGGRVMAKFYIKYAVNPTFEKTLTELHEANLCVGIKTLDPCITNDLVFGCLEKANYALSVVKGTGEADIPKVRQKVNSGVVALGSVHNFLEMLLLCERTGRNVKINNIIKIISAVLCMLLSTVFVMTNSSLNVIFCLIIQIFWLLPVAVISYFNK